MDPVMQAGVFVGYFLGDKLSEPPTSRETAGIAVTNNQVWASAQAQKAGESVCGLELENFPVLKQRYSDVVTDNTTKCDLKAGCKMIDANI